MTISGGFCPNLADLAAVNWEQILTGCTEKVIYQYAAALRRKGFELSNAGASANATLFSFLAGVASFGWNASAPANPFKPAVEWADGSKSPTPADLSDGQLNLLRELVPTIVDPEMKAWVADVVWSRKRDSVTAALAESGVDAYLASATRLEDPKEWSLGALRIQRALNLAKMLNKDPIVKKVVLHIEGVLARYNGDDPLYLTAHMMQLLLQVGEGDGIKYAAVAERAAKNAETAGDHHRGRRYLQLQVRWLLKSGNPTAAEAVKVAAAETYVSEANLAESSNPPNYMRAEHYLEQAIQAYRLIGHQDSKIEELHKRLLADQKLGVRQLKSRPVGSMDLSKMAEDTIASIRGKSLQDALFGLAVRVKPVSVQRLRKEVETMGRGIADLIHQQILDSSGKVVAQAPWKDDDDPEQVERVTQYEMRRHSVIYRLVTAHGVIEPARREILFEHVLTVSDWAYLLIDSPFVPDGREEIFARGLHAGLTGDLLEAGHLLIPQIENSIRQVFTDNGIVTSKLDQWGNQEDLTIDDLLDKEEFKKIFSADLEFDLRGLLVRKSGPNLRHRLAHGLISQSEFLSYDFLYLWGLVIHLCLFPLALRNASSQ